MAASRPAKTSRTSSAYAPRRISFGRITEQLEVPNLLALQTESFDWLVGNEAWQTRSTDDPHAHSGLAEILEEISPIEDFSGTMSLSFSAPRFDEVKASIEECKEKDLTYCAPLFVTAEFTNNTTGEIKSQTVFMGDFPMMTPKGTFVINGTERVVVSQLVRSPGVYFTKEPDKTSDRDLSSVKVIPSRAPGWSSTSTSATPWVSGSTASAGRPSPSCSRRSAGRPTRSGSGSAGPSCS